MGKIWTVLLCAMVLCLTAGWAMADQPGSPGPGAGSASAQTGEVAAAAAPAPGQPADVLRSETATVNERSENLKADKGRKGGRDEDADEDEDDGPGRKAGKGERGENLKAEKGERQAKPGRGEGVDPTTGTVVITGEKGEKLEADDVRIMINGKEIKLGPGGKLGQGTFVLRQGKEEEEENEAAEHGGRRHLAGASGEKKYGFLGVVPAPVGEPLAAQLSLDDGRGVVLAEVEEGAPAAKAGLSENDVLVQVDEQIVYAVEQLKKLVAARKPGSAVQVQFIHKGKSRTAKVVLGGTAVKSWAHREGGEGFEQVHQLHGLGQGMPGMPGLGEMIGQAMGKGMQGGPFMGQGLQTPGQCPLCGGPCPMVQGQGSKGGMTFQLPGMPGQPNQLGQPPKAFPPGIQRPQAGQPGVVAPVMPPAPPMIRFYGEVKEWTVPQIKELMDQVKRGISEGTWESVRKTLTALGEKKLTVGQAIDRLAPLKKEIGEPAWKWLTDKLQGKPVGKAPQVGEAREGAEELERSESAMGRAEKEAQQMAQERWRKLQEVQKELMRTVPPQQPSKESGDIWRKWDEYIRSEGGVKTPTPPAPVVEARLWTGAQIVALREQLHSGVNLETQDLIYKKLAILGGTTLTGGQAIDLLAPLLKEIAEVERTWLTDTLQGKQVGPCPVPGASNVPQPGHHGEEYLNVRVAPPGSTVISPITGATEGHAVVGVVTSTVSASTANYQATWSSRTGGPITVTLTNKDGKAILKDVPVGELATLLPSLDKEAQELLRRIDLSAQVEVHKGEKRP